MATKKSAPAAVKGPASYFPSIEEKYGHPVDYWFTILDKLAGRKHMEMVAHMKSAHAMGQGHANALVASHLSKKA